MLYFGFGSNLDLDDFARWCAAQGHPQARPRPLGPAWLPEHELVFHYHSRPRRGGALSVRRRPGAAVPGALFECDDATLAALDHKEGAGRTYARIHVPVLDARGDERVALTYKVTPAYQQARLVPPTEEYLAAVRRGLAAFGHPDAHLAAAASRLEARAWPDLLFVYGTLRRGEEREALLRGLGADGGRPATAPGQLVDLGPYPGLRAGAGRVAGELVALAEPAAAFEVLDEVEDFLGYGVPGSMYRRVLCTARDAEGAHPAWTYRYLGDDGAPIEGGDWSRRSPRG